MTASDGTKILTDPFDKSVGYPIPETEADIVTTSHNHFDHNYTEAVKGAYTLFNSSGVHDARGVRITGISTYHDIAGGAKRGGNIVFIYEVDGLRICHCGDLGHVLTGSQADLAGKIDILMVPVGGNFTINARQALEVVEQLKPKVVIPMHFKTDFMDFPIEKADVFLKLAGKPWKAQKGEMEITAQNIDETTEIILPVFE